MEKKYILALDEGTTSARSILFDRAHRIVAMAQHEIYFFSIADNPRFSLSKRLEKQSVLIIGR